MLFPTTLVGSYPQPEWLIDRQKLAGRFPPRVRAQELWRVPEPYLAQAQNDATLLAIRAQEEAGLDIITDGEIRRESYSNRFATALEGVDIDNPGAAHRRPHPQAPSRGGRRPRISQAPYRTHGENDRAGPVHHEPAGAERFLPDGGGGGPGLRGRGERGDPGSLRGRRRHRADRRAVHAGASGEGAPVRAQGAESRAGGRQRHHGGPYLLRLRRRHPRAPFRLFLPAGARRLRLPPGLGGDRAI